jgi:hypothetical protein
MTDLQTLYLIFAIVYLTQCVAWVPLDARVFSRSWLGRWQAGAPELELAAWKVKAVFSHPLPFLSGLLVQPGAPPIVTAEVIVDANWNDPAPRAGHELPGVVEFPPPGKIENKGNHVLASGCVFYRASSAELARHVTSLLRAIAKLPADQRAHAIEKDLRRQFDVRLIEERLSAYAKSAFWVQALANTLFLLLFAVAPAYVVIGAIDPAWWSLLVVTLLVIAANTWSFRRAYRALYPEDGEGRWTETLTVALSPFAAIRAADTLFRHLLAVHDPLAVACVVLRRPVFERFAARALREIRFPLRPTAAESAQPQALRAALWFRHTRDRIVESFLRKQVDDVEAFLAPPAANSAGSRSFCPRCRNQFRLESGECTDCAGVALVPCASERSA